MSTEQRSDVSKAKKLRKNSKVRRRAQLIEAGSKIFSTHSYDTVSTDAIAESAGISKGLFYHYFSGKRGFYIATLRDAVERFIGLAKPDRSLPAEAAVMGSLQRLVKFVDRNELLFRAIVRGGIGSDAEFQTMVEGARSQLVRHTFAVLDLAETPVLRNRIYAWVGAVEYALLDWLSHRDRTEQDLVSDLLRLLQSCLMLG